MLRWKNYFYNITLAFNCLLAFLLLFDDKLVIPKWLQVAGRMHPLVLHFPIVLIVLYALWLLIARSNSEYKNVADILLLLAAFSAVLTALMGLLLSREPGYDADALQPHKWMGATTSFVCFGWYMITKKIGERRWSGIAGSLLILAIVAIAGDLGADITHGDNFLLAPVTPVQQRIPVAFEDAIIYTDVVRPILEAKCMSCHNNKKAKGELIMETKDLLLKGGKNGKLWDTTKADLGLLMRRIHLPEDEKEHMPPTGKPQLSEQDITILYNWIKSGSSFTQKVTDLVPGDTMRTIASKILKSSTEEQYSFEAAGEKKIKQLNNSNRVVYPVALNSPALVVKFYNKPYFTSKALEELNDIKQQIVELNLSNMPVTDDDVKTISGFPNLRRLNLNYTKVTGASFNDLQKLALLKEISLAGTSLKENDLAQLQKLSMLKHVFLWNSGVEKPVLAKLNKAKHVNFSDGFYGDTVVMRLPSPAIQTEEQIIKGSLDLKLKSYVNGADIRYTLDGSDPDSISSPSFTQPIELTKEATVKVKLFKQGWISSDTIHKHFYKTTFKADSVVLIKSADKKYSGHGGSTLIDLEKSESASTSSGKWLGYRDNNMEALFLFDKTVLLSSVTLSMLRNEGGYIFPPESVTISGSEDGKTFTTLAATHNQLPKAIEDNDDLPVILSFKPTKLKYVKVIAMPFNHLPVWLHAKKDDKGWIFVDEVFFN